MSKAYLFAVMLLAASLTGCIEEADDIEKTTTSDEEETLKPIGEDNMSSLEKRVSNLEAKIAEYEMPKVYFLDLNENDYSLASYMDSWPDYEFYISDDGYLNCYYSEYYDVASCQLNALYYDVNGMIEAYSWEGSETDMEYSGLCQENTDPLVCLMEVGSGGAGWMTQDVCTLASVNQTLTLTVYDNDGNKASASYELDYFTNCGRTYEPNEIPEISFWVEEDSNGVYHVEVITVSERYDVSEYSFYLKDGSGSTYTGAAYAGFGEIAMQIIDGEEKGIDMNYGGDDERLQSRAANVSADNGEEFPVHFSDNDRDGMLSAGDQFLVYGKGGSDKSKGPAEDGWRLDIVYDLSGDIVGSAELN